MTIQNKKRFKKAQNKFPVVGRETEKTEEKKNTTAKRLENVRFPEMNIGRKGN